MSHNAVRLLLKDTADNLSTAVSFGYGQASYFNKIKDKGYPYIWLDPLVSTIQVNEDNLLTTEIYTCSVTIYKFDDPDSLPGAYELILDQTDEIAQEFIRDLNEKLEDNGSLATIQRANVTLSNISKQPFIKKMADVLTGFVLTFDLTVPDKFDYCP